jgi:RNA polymerase sigma-70 factor (ECF subfamily)
VDRIGPRRTPEHQSDAAIIAASLGHPATFGGIFDRHFDAVFGYFARRVGRDDASEMASETFRLAFGARHRFDARQASARPWLYGFATNVLRHHHRSRDRERRAYQRLLAGPALDLVVAAVDPVDAVDAARRWPRVLDALGELTSDERDCLLLLAWEYLTYAEIAIAVNAPIGTVRSRISRARRRMRELIENDGQQRGDQPRRVPEEEPDDG